MRYSNISVRPALLAEAGARCAGKAAGRVRATLVGVPATGKWSGLLNGCDAEGARFKDLPSLA